MARDSVCMLLIFNHSDGERDFGIESDSTPGHLRVESYAATPDGWRNMNSKCRVIYLQ